MLKSTLIKWENIHEHGTLWYQHLELRKKFFVDLKGWDIPHNNKVEWDQYDTGNTVYIVTHTDGNVVAASRINPCSFSSPNGSYMIQDAALGLLPGIPCDVLKSGKIPHTSSSWEATRFTADPELNSAQRNSALAQNAIDLVAAARELRCEELIALMPPAYLRWLSSIGLPARRLGATVRDGSGNRCCVMRIAI